MAATQTSYGKTATQTPSSVAPTNATAAAPPVTAGVPGAGAQTPYAATATAKPMSAALPAVSGAATPAAPAKFTGIDPSKSITGVEALQKLETAFGQPLTPEQRTQAMQYINYTDNTGAAQIGGADWNRLAQYAANLSGGQFANWAPMPGQTDGLNPVDPYPQEGPVYPETFQQPTIEAAPSYTAPTYTEERFSAPTQQEVYNDPGVRFREEQGRGALLASATARGMLGTGTTQRDLVNYGQDLASQEYQAAYNRKADTFDRNTGERRFGYGTRVEGAQASYAPNLVTWNARTDANQRAAELNFDRGWQRETYGRDDFYRRNRATEDDFRYRDNQAETRRRFLAELGAA